MLCPDHETPIMIFCSSTHAKSCTNHTQQYTSGGLLLLGTVVLEGNGASGKEIIYLDDAMVEVRSGSRVQSVPVSQLLFWWR